MVGPEPSNRTIASRSRGTSVVQYSSTVISLVAFVLCEIFAALWRGDPQSSHFLKKNIKIISMNTVQPEESGNPGFSSGKRLALNDRIIGGHFRCQSRGIRPLSTTPCPRETPGNTTPRGGGSCISYPPCFVRIETAVLMQLGNWGESNLGILWRCGCIEYRVPVPSLKYLRRGGEHHRV